jgi:hypothetical protein
MPEQMLDLAKTSFLAEKGCSSPNVLFLYNPFDGLILEQFVENLRRSLAARPQKIRSIYHVPACAAMLDDCGSFARCESFRIRGNEFRVYINSIDAGPVDDQLRELLPVNRSYLRVSFSERAATSGRPVVDVQWRRMSRRCMVSSYLPLTAKGRDART